MKTQYNQFYFLHINKNTAKTLGIRMFDPLYEIMESHGILAKELNKNHESHNHWKNFDDNTFIFSAVRDPRHRTLSEFAHWANYGDNGIRTHSRGRDRDCPFYTKDNLLRWLETKHVRNYQSKVIGKNVSRINMLIRTEDIQGNENIIRNKILNNFDISYNFAHYPQDYENAFMPSERTLNDIINDNLYIWEMIAEYNKQDVELYDQASNIF